MTSGKDSNDGLLPDVATPMLQAPAGPEINDENNQITTTFHKKCFLAAIIGSAFVVWGILLSLQAPLYPSVAEKKGATPSQVRNYLTCLYIDHKKPSIFSMDLCLALQTWQASFQLNCLVCMVEELVRNMSTTWVPPSKDCVGYALVS